MKKDEFLECCIELKVPEKNDVGYSCSYTIHGIDHKERWMYGKTSFEALCSAISAIHWTIKGLCEDKLKTFIKYEGDLNFYETSLDSLFCLNPDRL